METRVINVRHAAPKIWVDHKIQCAAPGELVSFSYEVKNKPDKVWVEAPSRGERHLIDAEGKITVVVRQKQEDLIIMAQKYGATGSVKLSSIPWWGLESPEA